MKDKLIIISIIQYTVDQLKELLFDAGRRSFSLEKRGVVKCLGVIQLQIYYSIVGDHWQGSPRDLQDWLLKYCKDQIEMVEKRN